MEDKTPLQDLEDLRDEMLQLQQESPEMDATWEWFKVADAAIDEVKQAQVLPKLVEAVEDLGNHFAEDDPPDEVLRGIEAFFTEVERLVMSEDLDIEFDTPKLLEKLGKMRKKKWTSITE